MGACMSLANQARDREPPLWSVLDVNRGDERDANGGIPESPYREVMEMAVDASTFWAKLIHAPEAPTIEVEDWRSALAAYKDEAAVQGARALSANAELLEVKARLSMTQA